MPWTGDIAVSAVNAIAQRLEQEPTLVAADIFEVEWLELFALLVYEILAWY